MDVKQYVDNNGEIVEAVQVTLKNYMDVYPWCNGWIEGKGTICLYAWSEVHSEAVKTVVRPDIDVWIARDDKGRFHTFIDENFKECFTEKVDEPFVPGLFVEKYYMMNPETEDVLLDGTELRDGMTVLLENPIDRASYGVSDRMHTVLKKNRWCTVTKLNVYVDSNTVRFVGVYEDGTKIARTHNVPTPWLVKLDSIPEEDPTNEFLKKDMVEFAKNYAEISSAINDKIRDKFMAVEEGSTTLEVASQTLTRHIVMNYISGS